MTGPAEHETVMAATVNSTGVFTNLRTLASCGIILRGTITHVLCGFCALSFSLALSLYVQISRSVRQEALTLERFLSLEVAPAVQKV